MRCRPGAHLWRAPRVPILMKGEGRACRIRPRKTGARVRDASESVAPAVSKDPFLNFKYKGAKGDKLVVNWVDTKGDKRTDEATVS